MPTTLAMHVMVRQLFYIALVILLATPLGSCATDATCVDCTTTNNDTTTNNSGTCETSTDCEIGFSCIMGTCQRPMTGCVTDGDCAAEKECVNEICVARPEPDMGNGADGDAQNENNSPADEFVICQDFDDFLADGVIDRRSFYEYGPDGVSRIEVRDADDASNDYVDVFSYDENGLLIRIERDDLVDGTFDSRESFQYDAEGRITVEERDRDLDGDPEFRKLWSYDADGLISKIESDAAADGDINGVWQFTWDINGFLRDVVWDGGNDGEGDTRYTFEHDTEGLLQRYERDSGLDGQADTRITYNYEGEVLLSKETDTDVDGTTDTTHQFQYDETPLNFSVEFIREIHPEQTRWLPFYRPPNRPVAWERFDENMEISGWERITYEEMDGAVQATVETDYQADDEVDVRAILVFDLPENCGQ